MNIDIVAYTESQFIILGSSLKNSEMNKYHKNDAAEILLLILNTFMMT